jgi:LysR family glycine cleavage system transcriptional activator
MDWLNLPSLNSLRAFSVVAETGSYIKAAERLNVTYPAISQQVKALEAYIDVALVVREGRSVKLSEEGSVLARDLLIAFSAIESSVTNIRKDEASHPVQITTSPAFAVEWLMPKITEFQQLHPEIMLMMNPTVDVMQLTPGGVDLAIRYIDRNRVKKDVQPVLKTDMVVIGSSEYLDQHQTQELCDLQNLAWLQELGTDEASDWFSRRGIDVTGSLKKSQMPGNLVMEAVRRGDGITYTARAFFQRDIDAGRIKVLHSEPVFGIYYLESNPTTSRQAVRTFARWIISKVETDGG